MEDAEDYAAFEMAVTADNDAQSAVERELVAQTGELRMAAASRYHDRGRLVQDPGHLLQFRQRIQAHHKRQEIIDSVYRNALAVEEDTQQDDDETSAALLILPTIDRRACRFIRRSHTVLCPPVQPADLSA